VLTAADLIDAIEAHTGRGGRRVGRNTRLLCPAHDDHEPSLDVAEGDTTAVVVNCRSRGCTFEQICEAVGLEPREFMPDDPGAGEWTPRGPAVATYEYVDAARKLLFRVCRTADKQFSQSRPDPSTKSGWKWNLEGVERVLYRLPEVLEAARSGGTVYVTEGEKDVHALERIGLVATCNPGGAGKWRRTYNRWLMGAERVVVVADDDPAGRAHAKEVTRSLIEDLEEAACTVELVRSGAGKDPHDHVTAGLGADDFLPLDPETEAGLLRWVTMSSFASVDEQASSPLAVDADGGTVIPADGFVIVYGDGGAGKTTLCVDMCCHLASGKPWLGLVEPSRELRIALVENEGPRPMFRLKLRAKLEHGWNGVGERVVVLEEPWQGLDFREELHRAELVRTLGDLEVDILVAGPLTRLGMSGAGSLEDVGGFAAHVADVQRRLDTPLTVVLVHHESKAGRVSGAWEGVPDTLVHVQTAGHGRTRMHWQKCRWSSALHLKTTHLNWTEGESFEVDEREELTPEAIYDSMAAYVLKNGGCTWNDLKKAVKGREELVRSTRDRLISEKVVLNKGKGRAFSLWHREDQSRPRGIDDITDDDIPF